MKGKSRLEVLRAAGMMSGPSLDGVNLAVVETDGVTIRKFGETRYRAFSEAERGLPISGPSTTGVAAQVSGGIITRVDGRET